MKLIGRLVQAADVSRRDRDAMFGLMDRHYSQVRREAFEADLDEKQWVIQVLAPDTETVCGFSTQMLLEVEVRGRPVKALFSGDTIVDREHWGDNALAHVWGRLALTLIETFGEGDLYWFLISKGYKTYRFLPVFFREFYPRHDAPTPPWAREVIHALGRARYPAEYDPTAGVIRAGPGKDRLREGIADITPERLRDPHVSYFVKQNPGHQQGEELCCLTPLTRRNFTSAARRVLGPEPVAVGVA
jgi:hypothetical protein